MFEFLQHILGKIIGTIAGWFELFWGNFLAGEFSFFQIGLDILLVAVIFYYTYLFIRGTRAVPVIIGILILFVFSTLANAFELVALNLLFNSLATMLIVAMPVIFQPELRRGLERLGRPHTLAPRHVEQERRHTISSIVEAVDYFVNNKMGSTIVIERKSPLREYSDTGSRLNSRISTELLLSIFQKKSPLHDGATIIHNDRILAASAVLPLSLTPASKQWGTRHKSALGLSEQTDAVVITTSEERGEITFFQNGHATEAITTTKLRIFLEKELLSTKLFFKNKKNK